MPVRVFCEYKRLRCPRKALESVARTIYRGEKIPAGRATNVVLLSDYRIRRLNARFRGIDRVTDVLSFNYDDEDLLGEIYISAPRARVQARRYGLRYEQELRRLLTHGLFHLLGYDHETQGDRVAMERKEREYCCLGEAK